MYAMFRRPEDGHDIQIMFRTQGTKSRSPKRSISKDNTGTQRKDQVAPLRQGHQTSNRNLATTDPIK